MDGIGTSLVDGAGALLPSTMAPEITMVTTTSSATVDGKSITSTPLPEATLQTESLNGVSADVVVKSLEADDSLSASSSDATNPPESSSAEDKKLVEISDPESQEIVARAFR